MQEDPLAMAMYAISVISLIDAIRDCDVQQDWFADNAIAAGSLSGLRKWWSGRTAGHGYLFCIRAPQDVTKVLHKLA